MEKLYVKLIMLIMINIDILFGFLENISISRLYSNFRENGKI